MLETQHGFLTYGFNCVPGVTFPHVYCEDLYVVPSARRTRAGTEMTDTVCAIAKERGITKVIGSINTKSKTPDASLQALQSYGMRLFSVSDNTIYMIKDL